MDEFFAAHETLALQVKRDHNVILALTRKQTCRVDNFVGKFNARDALTVHPEEKTRGNNTV